MKRYIAYPLFVILAFAFSSSVGIPMAYAQSDTNGANETSRTITVSGTGEASGTPDIAYLQIGTDQANSDPAVAFSNANNVINAVQTAVTGLGVTTADIQTTTLNMWVQNNLDNSGNPTGERTYHAQNIVDINVHDVTKAGDIISAAVNAGANNINGLSFGIADPNALANQARDMAIADAQARADQIASTLGVDVGPVMTVTESVNDGEKPMAIRAFGVGGGGSAPVSQGQLTVGVQVTITFAIAS